MLLAGIAFRPPYQRGASQTHSRTTDLPAVAGDHARRPLLILTFTVEPGSTACCFCDGIGAGSALSPARFFWRRAAACPSQQRLGVRQCWLGRSTVAVAYRSGVNAIRLATRWTYPACIRVSAHRSAQPCPAGKRQAAFTFSCD